MRQVILPCLALLAGAPTESAQIKIVPGAAIEVFEEGRVVARYPTEFDAEQAAKTVHYFNGQREHLPWLIVEETDRNCPRGTPGVFCNRHQFATFSEFRRHDVADSSLDKWVPKSAPKISLNAAGDGFFAEVERRTIAFPRLPDLKEERLFKFKKPPAPFGFMVEIATSVRPAAGKYFGRAEPRGQGLLAGPIRRESNIEHFRPINGTITDIRYVLPDTDAIRNWHRRGHQTGLLEQDLPWLAIVFTQQHLTEAPDPRPNPGSQRTLTPVNGGTYTALLLNHPANLPENLVWLAHGSVRIDNLMEANVGFSAESRRQWLFAEGVVDDPEVFRQAYQDYTDIRLPNRMALTIAQTELEPPRAAPQSTHK